MIRFYSVFFLLNFRIGFFSFPEAYLPFFGTGGRGRAVWPGRLILGLIPLSYLWYRVSPGFRPTYGKPLATFWKWRPWQRTIKFEKKSDP